MEASFTNPNSNTKKSRKKSFFWVSCDDTKKLYVFRILGSAGAAVKSAMDKNIIKWYNQCLGVSTSDAKSLENGGQPSVKALQAITLFLPTLADAVLGTQNISPDYTSTIQRNDTPSVNVLIAATPANTSVDLNSILSGTVLLRDHSALYGDAARHLLGTEDISIVWTQRNLRQTLDDVVQQNRGHSV